jgi:membrane protein YdbS with pleckstrin-like domain
MGNRVMGWLPFALFLVLAIAGCVLGYAASRT